MPFADSEGKSQTPFNGEGTAREPEALESQALAPPAHIKQPRLF